MRQLGASEPLGGWLIACECDCTRDQHRSGDGDDDGPIHFYSLVRARYCVARVADLFPSLISAQLSLAESWSSRRPDPTRYSFPGVYMGPK